jgi:hypothetical protein
MQTLQNTEPNWQLLYNKVRAENELLKRQLQIKPRSDSELKYTLTALNTFMDSMTITQGAVTCSALYDVPFFERDADPRFKRQLCTALVARYAPAQNLIERSFDLWKELS